MNRNVIEIPELDPEDTMPSEPIVREEERTAPVQHVPVEMPVGSEEYEDVVEKEYTADDFALDDEDEIDPNSLILDLDDDGDSLDL